MLDIVKFSKKIEDVVTKGELSDIADDLKRKYSILSSKEFENIIKELDNEGRLLKIGFVGKVKAGKSSLLNSLIFNGDNVLPKAATPMTPALTILQYGKNVKADIEFFSQQDRDYFEKSYFEYNKKLKQLTDEKYEELENRSLLKKTEEFAKKTKDFAKKAGEFLHKDIKDITDAGKELFSKEKNKKKAERSAKRELKEEDKELTAGYEQYKELKKSSIDPKELERLKSIEENTIEKLNQKLLDFVGADGKYTPFTKSVTLSMPNENLKDIQIIDTPGINDPVVSREERTRELLKNCDVVFIVSPAGQFLSNEDLDLMDRIYSKEGIKHLYIISSQIDNQLYGSEKEEGDGILPIVLKNIESKLTIQQEDVINSFKSQYPDGGKSFEPLLNNRVVLSSGVCFSLLKNFNNKQKWDSNMNQVWNNLMSNYEDYFNDENIAIENLRKLANIDNIKNIIFNIKEQKNDIFSTKKEEFIKAKYKALKDYKQSLIENIERIIKKISTTDINELRKEIESLQNVEKAKKAVNNEYYDLIEDLKIALTDMLFEILKSKRNEIIQKIDEVTDKETETFIFKDNKTYNTIKAKTVFYSLRDFTDDLEKFSKNETQKYKKEWKDKVNKNLVSTLTMNINDIGMLDAELIKEIIRKIIDSIEEPEINYSDKLPKELKETKTFKKKEADEFIQKAYSYVDKLSNEVKNDVEKYLNELIKKMKGRNIGKDIFGKYESHLKELENDINNEVSSLERYNNIIEELNKVN
jgi:hypothetical protein